MKALSVSIIMLTAVVVACAPQRRAPTVKSVKSGDNQAAKQQGNQDQSGNVVLDKNGKKVETGDSFEKAVIPTKKIIASKQSDKKIQSVDTAVVRSANAGEARTFKVEFKSPTGSVIQTLINDEPGLAQAATDSSNGDKNKIKSNAAKSSFVCLDEDKSKAPSDCEKLSVKLQIADEAGAPVDVEMNRVLLSNLLVSSEGKQFGNALIEKSSAKIGSSETNQITVNVVADTVTDQEAVASLRRDLVIDGVDVKLNIAGVVQADDVKGSLKLDIIKVETLSDGKIKIIIGITDSSDGLDVGIDVLKEMNQKYSLTLIVDQNQKAQKTEIQKMGTITVEGSRKDLSDDEAGKKKAQQLNSAPQANNKGRITDLAKKHDDKKAQQNAADAASMQQFDPTQSFHGAP